MGLKLRGAKSFKSNEIALYLDSNWYSLKFKLAINKTFLPHFNFELFYFQETSGAIEQE